MTTMKSLGRTVIVGVLAACNQSPTGGGAPQPASQQPTPGVVRTPAAENPGVGGAVGNLIRRPQVVVDEEVAVSASGWQTRGFTLPSELPVEVVAEGKTHTDKGFYVFVMSSAEYENNFSKKKPFRHASSFEGMKVKSFGKVDLLRAGQWYVVVQNSENLFNTMVVHLKVVVDPS